MAFKAVFTNCTYDSDSQNANTLRADYTVIDNNNNDPDYENSGSVYVSPGDGTIRCVNFDPAAWSSPAGQGLINTLLNGANRNSLSLGTVASTNDQKNAANEVVLRQETYSD